MNIRFRREFKGKINHGQVDSFDDDDTRYLMLKGGWGGGKTGLAVYKCLKLSALNQNIPGGILSPSLPEYKRDFLPMMQDIIDQEIPGARYYPSGKYGAFFQFPWTNAQVWVFSAERQIKGPNLGWGVVNEFSLMKYDRIKEFLARMRLPDVPFPQIVLSGTPEDDYDWLEDFEERHLASGKLKIRTSTSFDNPFVDENYAKELLSNLDEDAARVYVYGESGRIGSDYFFYAYKPKVNDFDVQYDPTMLVHATLDFNVGRMSCGFAHVYGTDKQKQIGYFDEMVLLGEKGDTEQSGREIIRRYGKGRDLEGNVKGVLVTCDASGKARKTTGLSDVKVLRKLGLKVRYSTANPRIKTSQLVTNGVLARRKLVLNPKKCPTLKADFQKVKQKKDFEQDKSSEKRTHMSDGARYLIFHEFPDWLDRSNEKRWRTHAY